MPEPPTGTVTFLLTDVEGSTRLWERARDGMRRAAPRQREIISLAVARHNGYLPRDQGEGDSVVGSFGRATDAVACALDVQRELASEPWPDDVRIRVRVALHTGEAELHDGNYYGVAVNRCARLRATAHGGQVVLSQAAADLARSGLPDGASLTDLGSHRLQDLADPEQVFGLAHADLGDDFPALRSLDALPNNLPAELTSFVGREDELAEVTKLLAHTRLLTFTGAAGCGKTRLALQVAADLLHEYRDGVWLVELAPLSDPELVPHEAASALSVQEEPAHPILATLVERVRDKHVLVILDNCEHLLTACGEVGTALLRGCPDLKVLATSREALGVGGETAWRVPSLSIPDEPAVPLESLPEYDAIRLFLDRAAASDPQFAPSGEDAPAIVQICRRLDGIPLALELAAGRVATMTCDQIAARLDNRFSLLTGGSRAALERQQTLRAAVDWSYELLTERERVLLRRLAVFDGGFTLEGAEAVCSGDPIGRGDVLDLLSHLVAKSLAVLERRARRYRLLETIRQYAREELVRAGEVESLRATHLGWYVDLAERSERALLGPEEKVTLDALEAEHDNLRGAIDWALTQGDGESALRLCVALGRFWNYTGYWTEGRERIQAALRIGAEAEPSVRSRALSEAAGMAVWQNDYDEAVSLAQAALELAEEAGDRAAAGLALHDLGLAAGDSDLSSARAYYERALAVRREIGDERGLSRTFNNLAVLSAGEGDLAAARSMYEEALALNVRLGDKRGHALSLMSLDSLDEREGKHADRRPRLEECYRIFHELGDRRFMVACLGGLGLLARDEGELDRAQRYLEEGLEIERELGAREGAAQSLAWLGRIAADRGDYAEARGRIEECLAIWLEFADEAAPIMGLNVLGWVAVDEGRFEDARALSAESLSRAANVPDVPMRRFGALRLQGEVALAGGDLVEARQRLEEGLAILTAAAQPEFSYLFVNALGRLALAEGDLATARTRFREALTDSARLEVKLRFPSDLEAMASVEVVEGRFDRAARLLGAADALREEMGTPLAPSARPAYEEAASRARTELGDEAFDSLRAEGAAMTPEDAVRYALEA